MNLIGETQQTFEKIMKESENRVLEKRNVILEVDNNIKLLRDSRQ